MWNREKKNICDNTEKMIEVVENFMADKPKKRVWGNFRIEGENLVYATTELKECWSSTDELKVILKDAKAGRIVLVTDSKEIKAAIKTGNNKRVKYERLHVDVIAIKLKQDDGSYLFVGNSSILPHVGKTVSYGNVNYNRGVTVIQRVLESKIPMIPFTVFEQAKLDVRKIKFLERGPAETVTRKKVEWSRRLGKDVTSEETIHFTGGSLFQVEKSIFLFDLDRREIGHKIFNPFLVLIPTPVKTIADAYQALKPKAVIVAEKQGKKVLRQGEWFFIPSTGPKLKKLTKEEKIIAMADSRNRWSRATELFSSLFGKSFVKDVEKRAKKIMDELPRPLELKAGNNRPNNVQTGLIQNKKTFVRGKVTHSGREHAELILKDWFEAVPNTATKSFTITGDID